MPDPAPVARASGMDLPPTPAFGIQSGPPNSVKDRMRGEMSRDGSALAEMETSITLAGGGN